MFGISRIAAAVVEQLHEVVGQGGVGLGCHGGVGPGEAQEDLAYPVDHLWGVLERKTQGDEEHLRRKDIGELVDEVAVPSVEEHDDRLPATAAGTSSAMRGRGTTGSNMYSGFGSDTIVDSVEKISTRCSASRWASKRVNTQ